MLDVASKIYIVLNVNLKIIIVTKASIRLANGPANPTKAVTFFWSLKYIGIIGTGYAHPNPINNSAIAPKGSRCFIGFKDSLP